MSSLERDQKSPTMHKLTELCEVMEVHPLTLLTLAYAGDSTRKADQLLARVRQELEAVLKERTRRAIGACVTCCASSTAPRHNGRGAVGGRQAVCGLLRDQVRSCVPSSPSIRRA
jgi:hypothetical protein